MAKKKRSKSSPRRTHLRSMPTLSEGQETDPAYDDPFLQELRRALRAKHPLDFLALVSSVVCATHPAYHPRGEEGVTTPFDDLVDSFVGTDIAETTAALHVLTRLVPDELFAARLRKVLATRREHVPAYIAEMDDASVVRTAIMTHVLGDGDNYLFDVRLADGAHLSAVVYVDHNLGTVVKDAFFIPEDLTRVIQKYEELMDPEQSIRPGRRCARRGRWSCAPSRTAPWSNHLWKARRGRSADRWWSGCFGCSRQAVRRRSARRGPRHSLAPSSTNSCPREPPVDWRPATVGWSSS